MAGAVLSFSMFCVGLLLSSNPDAAGDLVQVPSMLFQGSLLLGLISRATLGYTYAFWSLLSNYFFLISDLIPVLNQADYSLKRKNKCSAWELTVHLAALYTGGSHFQVLRTFIVDSIVDVAKNSLIRQILELKVGLHGLFKSQWSTFNFSPYTFEIVWSKTLVFYCLAIVGPTE